MHSNLTIQLMYSSKLFYLIEHYCTLTGWQDIVYKSLTHILSRNPLGMCPLHPLTGHKLDAAMPLLDCSKDEVLPASILPGCL